MKKNTKSGKRLIKKFRPSIQIFNLTIWGLVIIIGLAYLIQISGLVTGGYQIKDLESEISRLQDDARNLELQALKLQSMDNVKSKISQLNMVEAGQVDYLQPTPLVAAR